MPSELKPGVNVTLGGKVYIVPRWNLKDLREKVMPLVDKINDSDFASTTMSSMPIADLLQLYQLALRRNYRDMTVEAMEEEFEFPDFGEMMEKLPKVLEFNGFVNKPLGESQQGSTAAVE